MTTKEHLKDFRVKNFKRFKDFELNDIGDFNIIVGDNNVGKSTLLEALLFDGNMDIFFLRLLQILKEKNIYFKEKDENDVSNYLSLYYNKFSQSKTINFSFKTTNFENERIFDIFDFVVSQSSIIALSP